jgi:hypothetical protein
MPQGMVLTILASAHIARVKVEVHILHGSTRRMVLRLCYRDTQ